MIDSIHIKKIANNPPLHWVYSKTILTDRVEFEGDIFWDAGKAGREFDRRFKELFERRNP